MGNLKKTITFGDLTINVEIKENAPTRQTAWPVPTMPCPNREPDGFDAHIDRPVRENYPYGWCGNEQWRSDLSKYRKAESAVKACTWPAREPMGNTPCWPVPENRSVEAIATCVATNTQPRDAWGRFTSTKKSTLDCSRVSKRNGLVPVGAKVVGHTFNGEPIFDR